MEDPNEAVLEFCRTRDQLARRERETREIRTERNDAQRTLGNMVRDSMQTNDISSVSLDDGRRVCLLPGVRRSAPPATLEDALSIVRDLGSDVVGTNSASKLLQAVLRVARERLKERGPPQGPPRLLFKSTSASGGSAADSTPDETKRLLVQYVQAHQDCRESREALAPLRAAKRRASEALVPLLEQPVTVRMRASDDTNGRLLRLCRAEPAPTPTAPPPRYGGVRSFLATLREAIVAVLEGEQGKERGNPFETRLREELRRRLESEPVPPPTPPLKLGAIRVRIVPSNSQ